MTCPLCQNEFAPQIIDSYYLCTNCDLRFLDPALHLNWEDESARYDAHDNRSDDPNYQKFVSPVTDFIRGHIPQGSHGLDFGCGADSAVLKVLTESGYKVQGYDPRYFPDLSLLENSYAFITATEVIEHLHTPHYEFLKMRELIQPGGRLIVMTHLYSEKIDFEYWYYRRDPTHVCFYSEKTLNWIQRRYGFAKVEILTDRCAVFTAQP